MTACSLNGEKQAAEQRLFTEHVRQARASETSTATAIRISSFGVKMTRGHFLLARKGHDLCAFRFTNFYIAPDPERESGRMPFYYADYELYRSHSGAIKFGGDGMEARRITLGMNPFLGGHGVMRPDPGPTQIHCGAARLRWEYPTFVRMGATLDPKQSDPDVQLAPTAWTDIRQVDAADARVKWYRYDPTRVPVEISIEELWK